MPTTKFPTLSRPIPPDIARAALAHFEQPDSWRQGGVGSWATPTGMQYCIGVACDEGAKQLGAGRWCLVRDARAIIAWNDDPTRTIEDIRAFLRQYTEEK